MKSDIRPGTRQVIFLIVILMIGLADPAFGAVDGVASLQGFTDDIMIKSLGSWGVIPEKGMPLYHGDKILTTSGTAEVKFHDGASLSVASNSCVRIDESSGKQGTRKEIRLLVGQVKYSHAGKKEAMPTVLISPTAVAALRGTIVIFGTDGTRTFIDQPEGESDKNGEIIEGFVPEATPEQAVKNPNYQAARKAFNAWMAYAQAKRDLEEVRIQAGKGAYSAFSRTDRVVFLSMAEGQVESLGYANNTYYRLMGMLSKYALAANEEIIAETEALANHPDPAVAERAKAALERAMRAKEKIQEVIRLTEDLKNRLAELKERFAKAETTVQKKALLRLISATLEYNWAAEKRALAWMLGSEIATIGAPGSETQVRDLLKIADEVLQAAEDTYRKTENYVNVIINARDEATAQRYFKMAQVSADMVTANAAVATLVVNALETVLTGAPAQTLDAVFGELWRAVEARDRFIGILNVVEAEFGEKGDFDYNREVVDQILEDVESSADIYQFFLTQVSRRSMVLSPPVLVVITPDYIAIMLIPPLRPEILRVIHDDRDGDGWTVGRGDCNDLDPDVYPQPVETICDDQKDNDCDGLIDCEDPTNCLPFCKPCTDADEDGYFKEPGCGTAIDCDDTDPNVHPGVPETICDDQKDNDCDGLIDCEDPTDCGPICRPCTDADQDGFFAEPDCGTPIDCDDTDPQVNPDGPETLCNDRKDNDCDGLIDCSDEDCAEIPPCPGRCTDDDNDGFFEEVNCGTPVDCDDEDPRRNPGRAEDCGDEIDNDCDLLVDCDDPDCAGAPECEPPPVCTDADGDGFFVEEECDPSGDCDDTDPNRNPGAAENCSDGVDNDCDGSIDCDDTDCEGDPACEEEPPCTDADGDGFFAEPDCGTPVDCNDGDPNVNPDAAENCSDGIDNDCDGAVDCADSDCLSRQDPACCTDLDNDGYFVEFGCGTPQDCVDGNPSINPGAQEDCTDGMDNDCDDVIDCLDSDCHIPPDNSPDCCLDQDEDGYFRPINDTLPEDLCGSFDCDDTIPWINPGAPELCEEPTDEDCDGVANEDCNTPLL